MTVRHIWLKQLDEAWGSASICWLSGVRRAGKTTLCSQLPHAVLLNCDLPEVARLLEEPVRYFRSLGEGPLVLDEIHQLADPARVLKIAADEFPKLKVVATGSSTLAATEKFSDALTGRKRQVHLVPVLAAELAAFERPDVDHRLLRGGLPQALLGATADRAFYAEWLDSYFARDVRELFRIEKRAGFLALLEGLLRQSGGMMEATSLSRSSGLSRPTVLTYLEVMVTTHVLTLLRPWSGGGGDRELVKAPKAYGFDTGFVCHVRGIRELRDDDRGGLLEHLVLETLQSFAGLPRIHYWRDKAKREIDFVVPFDRDRIDAIEVKWKGEAFDPRSLRVFRDAYPAGRNWVVTGQTTPLIERSVAGLTLSFVSIEAFRDAFSRALG